jgi:hypothetical protein
MVPTYFLINNICSPALGEERTTAIVVIRRKRKSKVTVAIEKKKMTRGIKKGDWGAIYPDRAACTGKGPYGVDVFYIIVCK